MKLLPVTLSGICLLAARVAAAEVEISAVGGQHYFSSRNALGRPESGSPESALKTSPIIGARFTYLPVPRVGGELEVLLAPTRTADEVGVAVPSARFSAIVNLTTTRLRPFLLIGAAALVASPSDPVRYESDVRAAALAGSGLRFDLGDWWGLRADGRVLAFPGLGQTKVAFDPEWCLSIYGRFPPPPPPEERGRGPLIADADHDGLGDKLDKCPSVVGPIRNYGCPPNTDRDQDGIQDRADACPDSAGLKETQGCPDGDRDGFIDKKDRCPKEPGIAENRGCPDRDADGDTLVDRLDRCPNEPETQNGLEDQDGCPDTLPPPPPPPIRNLDAIDFTRGAAVLTPASRTVLDAAAVVLLEHPELNVEIVGHTDATGNEANNLRLSRARAEAVLQYLVTRGVPAARLTATGKGSTEPIAGATAEETNRKSRRVEFRFTPSGAP